MSATKDGKMWRCQFYYTDWQGTRRKKNKRGFKTKGEAEEWERVFLLKKAGNMDMPFKEFWELYKEDMSSRLRKTTMKNKEYIVNDKLLPYFGEIPLSEISAPMIRRWQNELISKGYEPTYLKTINNQLSAMMNYAVKYYDIKSNPCHKAGNMGKNKAAAMPYWTLEEFNEFADAIIDKRASWTMFNILFWTGMRLGEMLALTVKDINTDDMSIDINKSLTRVEGELLITPPKTEASVRTITMSDGLCDILKDYISSMYQPEEDDRLFSEYTKSYVEHEMIRGIKLSGVKKIHVHCLRHSHASMLVQMGFNPIEIAARLGHGKVTTTIETYCHTSNNAQKNIASRLSVVEKGGMDEE